MFKYVEHFFLCAILFTNFAFAATPEVEQFNKTGICIGCDLSDEILSSHDHANLTNALLGHTKFNGSFYAINLTNAKMAFATFANINASNADFSNANLTGANFSGSILDHSDFTGANLTGVDLSETVLFGAKLTQAQLQQVKSLHNAILPDGSKNRK